MVKNLALFLALAIALPGCATGSYENYLKANAAAIREVYANQKPMVRITAIKGMQITGLDSIEVFAPMSMPNIQQERPNEWAAVAGSALGVLGTVGGVWVAGANANNLAATVGASSNYGYSFSQPPGAVTTTSTVITDSYNPITYAPLAPTVTPADPLTSFGPMP